MTSHRKKVICWSFVLSMFWMWVEKESKKVIWSLVVFYPFVYFITSTFKGGFLVGAESQNHRMIKVGKGLSDHLMQPSTHPHHVHIPQCHISAVLEHLQEWWLHHCPKQFVLLFDHSFAEEGFPNTQPAPPLAQLKDRRTEIFWYWGFIRESEISLQHSKILFGKYLMSLPKATVFPPVQMVTQLVLACWRSGPKWRSDLACPAISSVSWYSWLL